MDEVKDTILSEEEYLPSMSEWPVDSKMRIETAFSGKLQMPEDFYEFYDFCFTLNRNNPLEALVPTCGLKLVGPFEFLLPPALRKANSVDSGNGFIYILKFDLRACAIPGDSNFSPLYNVALPPIYPISFITYTFISAKTVSGATNKVTQTFHTRSQNDLFCHWRYKYDPPEFQTVLASTVIDNTFHVGYFRDDPKDMPAFVASSGGKKENETFSVGLSSHVKLSQMGDNLFGAAYNYIQKLIQIADPFKQTALHKIKEALHVHASIKAQVFSLA